jgi:hypothetical protein
MIHSMSNPEFKLDVQTPSAAISEIAKGMSDLRDALKCMTELAAADCSVSALAPYLRQAWSGAAAVSMVCSLVGSVDWAGERWPGIPTDGSPTHDRYRSSAPQSRSCHSTAVPTACAEAAVDFGRHAHQR